MCERWLIFENFLSEMGERPKGHTIDRIDNSGNYSPENCRWALPREQSRNTDRNVWITWNGERKVLSDWASQLGVTDRALSVRIERWGLERAMSCGKLKNGVTKLTDEQVAEIRKARARKPESYRWGANPLAKKFGVSKSSIQFAANGTTFKDLPPWDSYVESKNE